jgi:hypothetical protein
MKTVHSSIQVSASLNVRYEQTVEGGWYTGFCRFGSVTGPTMKECETLLLAMIRQNING